MLKRVVAIVTTLLHGFKRDSTGFVVFTAMRVSAAVFWFVAPYNLHRRWRQHVPPRRWYATKRLYSATTQKTAVLRLECFKCEIILHWGVCRDQHLFDFYILSSTWINFGKYMKHNLIGLPEMNICFQKLTNLLTNYIVTEPEVSIWQTILSAFTVLRSI
jgi:hypothetical protein